MERDGGATLSRRHEPQQPLLDQPFVKEFEPKRSWTVPRLRWWLRLSVLLNVLAAVYYVHMHYNANTYPRRGEVLSSTEEVYAGEEYVPGMEGGQCSLCAVNPALCEELGPKNAIRGLGYQGENARLRRMLAKLRAGSPVNVAVLGGSVSWGFGIKSHTPGLDPRNMHRMIFEHLNAKFPGTGEIALQESRKGEGRNGFTNTAVRATGTDYYQYCFGEHLTDDVDLVLIEAAINDMRRTEASATYEQLVRALLDLPGEPAVINIHTFGLIFDELGTGGDMHLGVAEYYDIPTINLRSVFLPGILEDFQNAKKLFTFKSNLPNAIEGHDMRHIGLPGHEVAANLTNAYIDMQLCEMDRIEAAAGHRRIDELYPLPQLRRQKLLEKFGKDIRHPPFRPNCFSTTAKKNKLVPSHSEGWRNWFDEKVPEKKYLIADKPGASVSVKFKTTVGKVELFFLRSGSIGLGMVDCWVDKDMSRKVRIDPYMPGKKITVGGAKLVRNDLPAGDHELHCVLLPDTKDPGGSTEFRIISVMSV